MELFMNNKYYNHYNFYEIDKEPNFNLENLTLIKHFKTKQQETEETCGPCCALMVLQHLFPNDADFKHLNESKIAKLMNTRPFPLGTKFKDVVNFFKMINHNNKFNIISSIDYPHDKNGLSFTNFESFRDFIINYLKLGCPIIIENVDYGGHYKIIIGYDKLSENGDEDILIFADLYDDNDGLNDGYNYFPASRFYYMWFDDHCIEPEYRKHPFIIIKKK